MYTIKNKLTTVMGMITLNITIFLKTIKETGS